MTDTEFDELKRVCRIRGVPEPTEPTVEEFCEAQHRETVEIMRDLARKLRDAEPFVPGRGYEIPEQFRGSR